MAFIIAMVLMTLTFLIPVVLLYMPLPESVDEPWTYRIQGISAKLSRIVVSFEISIVYSFIHASDKL